MARRGEDFKTFINPESLKVLSSAVVEPAIEEFGPGSHLQFERHGYFYWDPASPALRPVLNRTVGLRDTWSRKSQAADPVAPPSSDRRQREPAVPASSGSPPELSAGQQREAARLREEYGLSTEDAGRLARDAAARSYFEAAAAHHRNPPGIAAWVLNEIRAELVRGDDAEQEAAPSPGDLAALVALIDSGRISGKIAKQVLAEMLISGDPPDRIVASQGLEQISDTEALGEIIDGVLARSADQVEAYRDGKTALRGYFVGQVMKETGGRANPELLQRLLVERLDRAG